MSSEHIVQDGKLKTTVENPKERYSALGFRARGQAPKLKDEPNKLNNQISRENAGALVVRVCFFSKCILYGVVFYRANSPQHSEHKNHKHEKAKS